MQKGVTTIRPPKHVISAQMAASPAPNSGSARNVKPALKIYVELVLLANGSTTTQRLVSLAEMPVHGAETTLKFAKRV